MTKQDASPQKPGQPAANGRSSGPATLVAVRRGLRPKLVLLVAGVLVGLLLGEIAARVFLGMLHRDPLLTSDPRAGWALRRNLTNKIQGGFGGEYTISTDREGHRITRPTGVRPDAHDPTVILVGDSFIQSMGADDPDAMAWILAQDTPHNVVNLGVVSYGTDQELVSLEAFIETHPAVEVRDVVVFVFANDFTDVQNNTSYMGRSKPRFRLVDGQLDRGSFHLTLSDRLMDVSALYLLVASTIGKKTYVEMPDPGAGIDLVIACLAAMRDAATRRGARFHVLAHHVTKLPPVSDSVWAEFRRRSGATDITERLRPPSGASPLLYDRMHWSAEVNKRAAEIVRERLEAPEVADLPLK
jgi:hypothetical protein